MTFALFAIFSSMSVARAETVVLCTAIADAATGRLIRQEGDCGTRVTPASTFKIAIGLMGYDSGILRDAHRPAMPFRKGYPDWVANWRTTTNPTSWMKNSVVWYSQQITKSLGETHFRNYVKQFHYGNEDISGDPGKRNGLTRAWLSSSLKISPLEQLGFIQKIVRRELPVSPHAYEIINQLTGIGIQTGGWRVHGKTGSGFPRKQDGALDRYKGYGWFVGWATREGRTVAFARLIQGDGRQTVPLGIQARDAVLRDLFSTPNTL
ncbi:class D beta-lactamase [Mesorhizobium sp. RMAD-H1]|uniref:class D beta-lactamase n=1 Tax=Mesorhizobium sp. RMAD-H1 TaxID=2587065 RepID=UPI00182838E6|nr:class D beta-lactamase [Mesorhizobium sp. RMAD-H1]MBB2970666.1 beta-lactamase class D [Mesorhizobium sp. RMAD-H1]